ncbi:PREDICTED: NADH dehydrogenase [ubiquinone] 1 subunit C2 [Dinoponera quadriceps]|uniref:NADH dehydrogenase [ubiquinone] 1 subunit C2 n=1 Tax=Dinoponera quadriceps TaxID=609295 RepID=A0A6P3XFL0_DINQU|nr:PREDICTED: NADH dehydrogenase [ubiquinone] 1 subunit C2 [Dinoponera quadriceps]
MDKERYSENPDIEWALDLLRPESDTYEPNILRKYTGEFVFVGAGAGLGCFRNYVNRRPLYAGLQFHAAFMAAGFVVAKLLIRVVDHFKAERDTRLRTYVKLHPELFPKPERVKYKDIFKPWSPIR